MTDAHIRILQLIAQQKQRELRERGAVDDHGDAISVGRRKHLQRAATRTRTRVMEAQARRRATLPMHIPEAGCRLTPRVDGRTGGRSRAARLEAR